MSIAGVTTEASHEPECQGEPHKILYSMYASMLQRNVVENSDEFLIEGHEDSDGYSHGKTMDILVGKQICELSIEKSRIHQLNITIGGCYQFGDSINQRGYQG
jgi:hypothetical protein